MIVRMGLLRRKKDLPVGAFRRHWRDVHGPLAAHLPGLLRYHQNHIVSTSEPISHIGAIDGISELWFEDAQAMHHAVKSPQCRPIAEDEPNLIGDLKLIVAEQDVVIAPPQHSGTKFMILLRRRDGLEPQEFRRLFVEHARLARECPGLEGCVLSHVVDRGLERGRSAAYGDVPVDGICEAWFADVATLEAALASPGGRKWISGADSFADELSSFVVEVHEVV
ncbi:uncharacterized protein (TIGR02118 family) [Skermanella aerolata]|uniref:EthD domain-containing protein n=1 Tax=Skermanella aerolata TaxID=393310 RepID=UPI003D1DD655